MSSGWRFQKLKPEVGGFFGSNEGCSVFLEEKGEDPCGLGCRPFICWLKGKKMGGNGLELVRGSVCGRLERSTGGAELLIFSRKRGIK